MTARTNNREAGMAVVMVVIVISIVAVVVGVLMQAADGGAREATRTMARAEQIAIADTAVSRYLGALNSKQVNGKTNFQLTTAAFTGNGSLLAPYLGRDELRIYPYAAGATSFTPKTAGTVCKNQIGMIPTPSAWRREASTGGPAWPVDDGAVGQTRFIVEENHKGRSCAYWEVYRVDPTMLSNLTNDLSSHRHIGVMFRVWSASSVTRMNGVATLNPRYVQTRLARGSFSDYQLLTDDHIEFGSGVNITGKVHSNNYDDGGGKANAITGPGGAGAVTCTGPDAKVTAQSGGISFGTPACRPDGNTNKAIDLGAFSLAVMDLHDACKQDPSHFRTRCLPALGGPGYDVEVGSPIRVYHHETKALIATIDHGSRPYALLLEEDNVYVRDGAVPPTGSVSIFAHSDEVSHLHIQGKSFGPPVGSKPVVGLLAQGDIVIDAVQPGAGRCDFVRINAAMMSETGTLTVPHKWLSQIRQKQTPKCGTLEVNGALSTRTMPVLQLVWNSVFGFNTRQLNWNNTLKRVVPPMYPATGPWEMGTWREANHDCIAFSPTVPPPTSRCAL